MSDGVKIHTLAWCDCGWESPHTTGEMRAMRHLLVHRWLDHDGPEPRSIPAIYRKQVKARRLAELKADDGE